MIIYVDDPEDCGIKIGDTLKFKDNHLRSPMVVTAIRKSKKVEQPEIPHFRCPHCDGDLDDYMEA